MTITLKVCEKTKNEMQEFFEDFKRPKTPPYAVFQAEEAGTVITNLPSVILVLLYVPSNS